jgi:hypothetical protein
LCCDTAAGAHDQAKRSPIQLGALSEGGLLVHARGKSRGRLVFKDFAKFDRWNAAANLAVAVALQ